MAFDKVKAEAKAINRLDSEAQQGVQERKARMRKRN